MRNVKAAQSGAQMSAGVWGGGTGDQVCANVRRIEGTLAGTLHGSGQLLLIF